MSQSVEKKDIIWFLMGMKELPTGLNATGTMKTQLPSFEKPTQHRHVYIKQFNLHFEKPIQPKV